MKLHFYVANDIHIRTVLLCINILRAGTPFLLRPSSYFRRGNSIIVSMPSRAKAPFLLIMNFVNGLLQSLVSMPSRAKAPFLPEASKTEGDITYVSMPSRAKAPFLRYPFKNLGFMRFLEPVFAGIYQNILTTTIFRAC